MRGAWLFVAAMVMIGCGGGSSAPSVAPSLVPGPSQSPTPPPAPTPAPTPTASCPATVGNGLASNAEPPQNVVVYPGADKPAGTWVIDLTWDTSTTVGLSVTGAPYQRPQERVAVPLTVDIDGANRRRACWSGLQQYEYAVTVTTTGGFVRFRTWPPI